MKSYSAFLKKEICELTRTYKLFILLIFFFLLGILNPLTANYMPQLMDSFLPNGMILNLPAPTAMDSWVQFYKNVPQLGFILLVLVFSGTISTELTKGTLIPVLTKGLSRKNVILAKFTSAAAVFSASYLLCFLLTFLYTRWFWDTTVPHVVFAGFCLWVFGIMLISVVLLGGVVSTSTFGTLLFTGLFIVMLILLQLPAALKKFQPLNLVNDNTALLSGSLSTNDFYLPLMIAVVLIVAALTLSVLVFNRKKL